MRWSAVKKPTGVMIGLAKSQTEDYHLGAGSQGGEVEGGLTQIDSDRFNLHGLGNDPIAAIEHLILR
jgi:hypothetical protein